MTYVIKDRSLCGSSSNGLRGVAIRHCAIAEAPNLCAQQRLDRRLMLPPNKSILKKKKKQKKISYRVLSAICGEYIDHQIHTHAVRFDSSAGEEVRFHKYGQYLESIVEHQCAPGDPRCGSGEWRSSDAGRGEGGPRAVGEEASEAFAEGGRCY